MKTHITNLSLLPALLAGLLLMSAGPVTAQTFTTLYSFTGGSDGALPFAGLILSGNTLYGTTGLGGSSGYGTVFAVNTDGTGFTTLYSFTGGSDGSSPQWGGLLLSGNTLYGTAAGGGSSGSGTVFAVNTDGTGFTTLYSFTFFDPSNTGINSDGAIPIGALIISGNTVYGTAQQGGERGHGTVFAVNTDGTGFTTLYSFTGGSDGGWADGGLVLSGETLYGTTIQDGVGGGTVFALNTNGTDFAVLASGDRGSQAALILSGNTLYGTTVNTVFKLNTDGTGSSILHSFTAIFTPTNSDGHTPLGALILSGNTLYGTAKLGGSSGRGTVFAVNTDGTGFTTLYSFTATTSRTNSDGANPTGGLILLGNTLYGTAYLGGSSGYGTVFSLSLPPPQLTIIPSGANVILTWPTNAPGFTLQSTTNLGSLAFWTTNSPGPVVVNGQNTVTNPISGAQQFYRLSQ